MARFWKDAERKSYQPQGPSPEIAVPASDIRSAQAATSDGERDSAPRDDMRGTSLFLGKGSRVSGKLACRGPGRIDGEVEGEISSQDTLIFGESAIINGQIEGASIVVQGRVTGDITARNRLEIRPPVPEGRAFRGKLSDALGGLLPRGGPSGGELTQERNVPRVERLKRRGRVS